MVDQDAAIHQGLLKIAIGHGVSEIEEDRRQDHLYMQLHILERHHLRDLIYKSRGLIEHRAKVCDRT